jgi:hypothetical protein
MEPISPIGVQEGETGLVVESEVGVWGEVGVGCV